MLKTILKWTINASRSNWHIMCYPALWVYWTTVKTATMLSPFQLVHEVEAFTPVECEIPSLKIAIHVLPDTSDIVLVVEPNLPDPKILFSCDCNPGVLYTCSPCLGVRGRSPRNFFWGCVLANSIADPWYWVNPRIFPLYFPYKREHCKSTGYGIVLY